MPRSRRTPGLQHRLIAFVFAVVHRPRLTLALALLVLAGSAALAWFKLDVSTDQDQLFSSEVPFFRDYLSFTKAFPENQAGYVIIQAKHPDHPPAVDRWTGIADAITNRLAADHDDVRAVEGHVSVDQVGPQGLLFSDDAGEVPRARASIERLLPLVQRWGEKPDFLYSRLGPSPLQRFVSGLSRAPAADLTAEAAGLANLMAKSWCQTLDDPRSAVAVGGLVPDLADLGASSPRDKGYAYIADPDHPGQHLLLIKLFERANLTSKDGLIKVIAGIRRDMAEASAPYAGEFDVGLSGRPALDADELETTDRDSRRAEIVSLSAVFLGLVLFLRSVWLAVAAEIALVVGIGWTFGWATISTAVYNHAPRGDLNLLSTVFLIALIGIGMDYLIQVLTRYRQEAVRHGHDAHRDARAIWAGVFKHVAAPINTACLGAAGAFLVSVFTPFRGAAELGLIAGGGLLLCLATGYIILPALLTVFPPRIKPTDAERAGANAHLTPDEVAAGSPRAHRNRRLVLPATFAVLLLAGLPLMRRTSFDPGLLTLQAQNLQSVQLIRKLPTWFEVELSPDLALLRRVRTAIEKLPTVDHTESVLNAFDNYDYLKAHPLPQIPWVEPTPVSGADLPGIAERALALADRLSTTQSSDPATLMTAAGSLRAFASRVQSAAHGPGAAPDLAAQRLTLWQQAFVGELHALLAPFYPAPPNVEAMPETIRGHLLAAGDDGRYALYIYPKHDCWQQANLVAFVTTVEAAVKSIPGAPPVTGVASDVFHSTDETHAAFRDATLYALALIFVLVLLDLRNLWQTLLAISVLALGLPMLVAVMGLLGMHWNFANFFGLPILIGAGHEYGVFMVHRYNEACRDPHRPWRKWDVSDRALLLCGYVTSISFGFFWLFGHHLGLKSLGLVMALGIACIYLATVCVLRPLLLWKLAAGDGCAAAIPRPEAGRAKEAVPG